MLSRKSCLQEQHLSIQQAWRNRVLIGRLLYYSQASTIVSDTLDFEMSMPSGQGVFAGPPQPPLRESCPDGPWGTTRHIVFLHEHRLADDTYWDACVQYVDIVTNAASSFLNRACSKRRFTMQRSNILGYTQAIPNQTSRRPLRAPPCKIKNKIGKKHQDMGVETGSCSLQKPKPRRL